VAWQEEKKRLDYMGIPFHCNHCHCTSHLCRDCKGSEEVEELDEELANWDVSDFSPVVELFGSGDPIYQSKMNQQEVSTEKLFDHYKKLFQSKNMVDIRPDKLVPTWRNGRQGTQAIAKHLDRCLLSEGMLSSRDYYRTLGGISVYFRSCSNYFSDGYSTGL
jgi:hypothetical protein